MRLSEPMKIPRPFVDAVVRAEDALDRLKLSYKERFDRFAPAAVVPYRGYGRPDRLVVRGRVLEANEAGFEPEPGIVDNVRNTIRRLETDEIRGARLRATFRGQEIETRADDEAFFELRIDPDPPVDPGWHGVEVEILESMAGEHEGPARAEVLVPPADADFIVVSDLDDTVLRTGADDALTMFRTVLLNDAHSRTPFEGVAALYRALEAGPSGKAANPLFYISRSPWNLYEMLAGFLDHHGLPKGPLLLKDYGMHGMLGHEQEGYKHGALTELLDFFPDTPFVLIGDSGQHDPEVYREIARARPDRIRAIIVRDVTAPERDREVHRIADELDEVGVPMIMAEESESAAKEAVLLGLLAFDRLEEIAAERKSDARADGRRERTSPG